MEAISLKLNAEMLKSIDASLGKHNYSTRTELIRDAIREKLENLTKEELINEFLSFKGKSKTKTTDAEYRRIRDKVFEDFGKDRGWN